MNTAYFRTSPPPPAPREHYCKRTVGSRAAGLDPLREIRIQALIAWAWENGLRGNDQVRERLRKVGQNNPNRHSGHNRRHRRRAEMMPEPPMRDERVRVGDDERARRGRDERMNHADH